MKLVLTNDDGIEAPGIEALRSACEGLGDVTIVAPRDPHSSTGHRVTVHGAIEVEPRGTQVHAVHGTPADCSRLALTVLVPDADWVLAGINCGGNLGTDLFPSGTVAAAREAALLGHRAIAISQFLARPEVDWGLSAARARRVLERLMEEGPEPGTFFNVNLPHPEHDAVELELVHCSVDPNPLDVSFRKDGSRYWFDGSYQGRRRAPGQDVAVCFGGAVSVSCVDLIPR